MQLDTLFPPSAFNKDEAFPSAQKIMSAIINRIHFERRNARNVGFRGMRPFPLRSFQSGESIHGFTCKILQSDLIYALIYTGESKPQNIENSESSTVWSQFSIFGFPMQDAEILENFSLHAIHIASQEDYDSKIRDWTFSPEEYNAFYLGSIFLAIKPEEITYDAINCDEKLCDKNTSHDKLSAGMGKLHASACAMNMLLEAKARFQTISAEGVSYDHEGKKHWLIEPNGYDANIPCFSLAMPLFDTIARSFAYILEFENQENTSIKEENLISAYAHYHDNESKIMQKAVFFETDCKKIDSALKGKDKQSTLMKEAQRHALFNVDSFQVFKNFSVFVKKEFVEDMPLIHILSGFLGSGKTTFLREWLAYLQNRDTYMGVIQNEFGQIGLDAHLLKDDTVVEALDEGCVCCSLADALRPGILRIQTRMPKQDVLLETSGLANPNNVATALDALDDIVKKGLVISVNDAKVLEEKLITKNTGFQLDLSGVTLAQVEGVDILVLNKIDLVTKEKLDSLKQALKYHNPRAVIVECSFGRIPFALLDDVWDVLQAKKTKIKKNTSHTFLKPMALMNSLTHKDDPDGAYSSYIVHFARPTTKENIRVFIEKSNAIRVKGLVDFEENSAKLASENTALESKELTELKELSSFETSFETSFIVQHSAGITNYNPIYFEHGEEKQERYLVFIGKNLNLEYLKKLGKR